MAEKEEEKKTNTEELKDEATNTVKQVKDTIKKVDIKKDSVETKGFIIDMFKNPLEKIKEIAKSNTGKYFTYAIIIAAIWVVSELIYECFSLNNLYGYSHILKSILKIIISIITPILTILTYSLIIYVINKDNKKSLTTIITIVVSSYLPVVAASIVKILTLINSKVSQVTNPFAGFCNAISIVLLYFGIKSILGTEKNSEFIKKFVLIEGIFYIVYLVLSLLGIYI